ncbi:FKBP-type peptidyl-prolyl cis-trans isomerase [Chitinophaga sp. Cy-1792]|uniref:FKBP-type peptidyl-prolyl cis-trans isomerase n=1 Tax=Chitinophaga sp. Cy-1792 TaxID=2608339 RepID=UPI00141F6A07|nr:FKBP-type peptidyl-prolyl cis-trans isomerase [Chitinophaga sp. Cy-1792]NIG57681.1 peptidylprolyl isomerase [Chitinophaga sp. Cy-1792]
MKKFLILGAAVISFMAACKKSNVDVYDPYPQYKIDSANIQAYLQQKGISAEMDSLGFFYKITQPGTGTDTIPSTSYYITAGYKGYTLNGTVFDGNDSTNFSKAPVYYLVPGWYLGLRHITKGGKITLYLPSFFAYGQRSFNFNYNNQSGTVPANSPLIFEINLMDFAKAAN